MKILHLIFLILVFSSCERVVTFDGTHSLIVVNSLICPDSLMKINISKSVDLSVKDTVLHLDNALIKIFCNDTLKEEIVSQGEGIYQSSFKPELNKNYKIQVSADGFTTVTSKTTIPEKPTIASVMGDSMNYNGFSPRMRITIRDNPSVKNYYYLNFKSKVSKHNYLKDLLFLCNDNSILGNGNSTSKEIIDAILGDSYVGNNTMYWIAFSDNTFNGSTHTIEFFVCEYIGYRSSLSFPVYVELKSISEEYYNYLKSREYISRAGTNLLSEPVQVYNNIEGGAGIFGSYNLVRDSITTILPVSKK